MEFVRTLLEQQPLMALFLTIAIGYSVGALNFKGFSLGVGAVLFVALIVGWFAPKSAPDAMVGTLGLSLFLYAIGIQYGAEFFRGLASADGLKANLLALVGVLLAGAVTIALVYGGVKLEYAVGLFAGSGTSTPTLQAAIQVLGNDDPAIGYSVAYPFGVAGPILALFAVFNVLKPKSENPASGGQQFLEIAIRHPEIIGKRLDEIAPTLPAGVTLVAVRENDRNRPVRPETILQEGHVVLAVGPGKELLEQTRMLLGETMQGRISGDRRDLDYLRVFLSQPALAGRSLRELAFPAGAECTVLHVRRGDADLQPQPDLVLEFGDRIGLLTDRPNFPALRSFFGDSIKGTAEFSYISIGLGMALGFLVGAIHVPIPGGGQLGIGLAGVLVVALVLGRLRRTGRMNWTIPLSANLVLRNLGLTLFLAQVGMSSGPKFVSTLAETGLYFLALGAIIVTALVLPIILLGLYVFRMPFDRLAGIVAGACGNAAILAYANKTAPTDRPDIAYAMIFPGMTIVKILFVDLIPLFLGS